MNSVHSRPRSRSRSRSILSDKSEKKEKTHHSTSVYHTYSIEFKLKIIKLAETQTLSYLEREYKIDRHLIRKWIKEKDMMIASRNKSTSYKIIKNGGIPSTFKEDGIIASYIKELRNNSLPVNTTDVILYAKEIVNDFKERSILSLRSWAYRFIKRMGFSFRTITKLQTKKKDNINEYVSKYFVILRKMINDKDLLSCKENIGNADETPVFIEMNDKKTINIIGEKEISIRSFNKNHTRITVMLTILGKGKSLKPFVIFNRTSKGPKESKLRSHPKVRSGDIYICCQPNSWMDETTMLLYLKEIWFSESIYKRTKNTLLIVDRARSHISNEITNIFKQYNSNYVLIPPGLTSLLQPLDTHINKTFKYNIKNEYHQWLVKNKDISLNDNLVIDFIYNAWYKSDQINKEKLIENSFLDDGITLKTDGS